MYNFNDILGNEHIINNLKMAVETKKISHAYIINGNEGSGKKLLSKVLAKGILCEGQSSQACNRCSSCHSFDSDNNPDVIYIRPEKKTVGVKEIRQSIVDTIEIKPYKYERKVYIIENADKMTLAAQNTLLKSLEEPPSYVVFILLANNIDLFLPTILSRCVVVKLRSLNQSIIMDYLIKNTDIAPEEAGLYCEYSQGSIGNALRLIQSEQFKTMRDDVISWFMMIKNRNYAQVLSLAEQMKTYKDNREFLDIGYMWYRDMLMMKKTGDERFVIQKDKIGLIKEQSSLYKETEIINALDCIWNAKKQLGMNASFQVCMEVMLLGIKGK